MGGCAVAALRAAARNSLRRTAGLLGSAWHAPASGLALDVGRLRGWGWCCLLGMLRPGTSCGRGAGEQPPPGVEQPAEVACGPGGGRWHQGEGAAVLVEGS